MYQCIIGESRLSRNTVPCDREVHGSNPAVATEKWHWVSLTRSLAPKK